MPQRLVLTFTCPTCDGTGLVPFDDTAHRGFTTEGVGGATQRLCPDCRDNHQRLGKGRVEEEVTIEALRSLLAE